MFTRVVDEEKVKLSGFNNLTKILSFNLYDFCITLDKRQRKEYIEWINEKYNAEKLSEICLEICRIIEAEPLAISEQNYDPVGASNLVLMSDLKGGGGHPILESTQVKMHLNKSHIAVHTYPDAADPNGICSFRVDIDIATCGEIIPLDAINYLFDAFETDVVYVDYVVRGYTRLANGNKIYNDHYFNSIQDFINPEILQDFEFRSDLNIQRDNIWQSKFMVRDFPAVRYLMDPEDVGHPDLAAKMRNLQEEMRQVFHMIH